MIFGGSFVLLSLLKLGTSDYYVSNDFSGGALRVTDLLNANLDVYSARALKTNETYQISDVFETHQYDYKKYPAFSTYSGSDSISMMGSSLANNIHYTVTGAYGYNFFDGRVSIYTMLSTYKWGLHTELTSPIAGNINFGISVDIAADQNLVIIGANSYSFYAGVAFTYELAPDNATWALTGSIQSPSGPNSGFGSQVKVHGDFALVATLIQNAYIYERQSTGKYVLASTITVDGVITSISLSGHLAAVGVASYKASVGRVYVYALDASDHVWHLQTVVPSAGGENSYFGHSVSIGNHTLVVGAPGEMSDPFVGGPPSKIPNNNGAVFVYDKQTTFINGSAANISWALVQRLNSTLGQNDYFGSAVHMSLDQEIVVGASGFPNGTCHGSAFVYIRDYNMTWVNDTMPPNNWVLQYALPSSAGNKSSFGAAISIAPGLVVVGAYGTKDLVGSLSLVAHDQTFPPRRHVAQLSPTMAPTPPAEKFDAGAGALSNIITSGTIVAIVLAGLFMLFLLGLIYYWKFTSYFSGEDEERRRLRLQMEQDDLDAKEKERARLLAERYYDDSVASSSAYGDGDEDPMAYSRDFQASYDDHSEEGGDMMSMSLRGSLQQPEKVQVKKAKKGGEKEGVKTRMTESELRVKFPYKVHSYAGYEEGQYSSSTDMGGVVMKKKMDKDAKYEDNAQKKGAVVTDTNQLHPQEEEDEDEDQDDDATIETCATDGHGASRSDMTISTANTAVTGHTSSSSAMSVATARIEAFRRTVGKNKSITPPPAINQASDLSSGSISHSFDEEINGREALRDPIVYIDRTASLDVNASDAQQTSHPVVKRLVDDSFHSHSHASSPLSVGHVFSSSREETRVSPRPINYFTTSNPLREVEQTSAPLVDVVRGTISVVIPPVRAATGRSSTLRGPLSPEHTLGTPLNTATDANNTASTLRAATGTVSDGRASSKAVQSYQAYRAKLAEKDLEERK